MNDLNLYGVVMLLNIDFCFCTFVVASHNTSSRYTLVCLCMCVCVLYSFLLCSIHKASKSWPYLIWQLLPAHMLLSEG